MAISNAVAEADSVSRACRLGQQESVQLVGGFRDQQHSANLDSLHQAPKPSDVDSQRIEPRPKLHLP